MVRRRNFQDREAAILPAIQHTRLREEGRQREADSIGIRPHVPQNEEGLSLRCYACLVSHLEDPLVEWVMLDFEAGKYHPDLKGFDIF